MGSCFTVKKYFKVSVILVGFLLIILSLMVNPHAIQADSWNIYQITESNLNNSNIDVDIDF
ncbi:MAG: hypothetical protein NUV31_10015, partial [Dehalococcoidales bacterium]|nr:hypothetical protein [Dehalococcoidales bacterium]